MDHKEEEEEEKYCTYAYQLVSSCTLPMVLKVTINIGVLQIIHDHPGSNGLSSEEIATKIKISNPNAPSKLDRMLRLLATYSIVRCTNISTTNHGVERRYSPSPVTKYFVLDKDNVSLAGLLNLFTDKVLLESWTKLGEAVIGDDIPFNMVHGMNIFDYACADPRLNEVFNKAMHQTTPLVAKQMLVKYKGLENIHRLVDVGGGIGHTLRVITSKYPSINGINFDLPHVIQNAPPYTGIEHVSGDMFESIPEGDAIFMKENNNNNGRSGGERLKRFESLWLSNDECEKVVQDSWNMGVGLDTPGRICSVLDKLSDWARLTFGDIKKRVKQGEKRLKELQSCTPDANTMHLCDITAAELNELRRLQESYWHIRAKAKEFRDGDRNTSYFHHKASSRKRRNSIHGLFNEDKEWKTDAQNIEGIITTYFQNLFASSVCVNMEEAVAGVTKLVTEEMNTVLNTEPSMEEIRLALFQMHPHKSPGPDGMHALFYQKFWHIVGFDIASYIKSWWRKEITFQEINNTCIALIPKCSDPKCMNDYRPISLCNVLYKIASKTMANRMKPILNSIISINQSAFVPKRLITDNALIGFEIFHSMKRRGEGKDGSIALKLDMSKAYDRVEWDFLSLVMRKMGFNKEWVDRVYSCISSVSFSFKLNGESVGLIHPSRGLRQGDPISPYLFLICAEAFSMLINKAANEGHIHGARICKGAPRISHLFFADDSLLFARANLDECSKVADIISLYERASGQKVNLNKSEVAFSNGVSVHKRWEIIEELGVNEVERHEKYLGLPTIIGRSYQRRLYLHVLRRGFGRRFKGGKRSYYLNQGRKF